MQVAQILKEKGSTIITVGPDDSILDAAKLLKAKNIGTVVVAGADGGLAGILSERDIARAVADRAGELSKLKVKDLMTSSVITCNPDQRLHDLMKEMTDHRIRHIPIVDDSGLVGIISIGDVVKYRLAELESETSMLREYITG